MKIKFLFLSLAAAGLMTQPVCAGPEKTAAKIAPDKIYEVKTVLVAPYSGVITPAAAEFIGAALSSVNGPDGADMLVIALDTPGGLDISMRTIIQGMLASKKPVAVYVSPQGARAASAGVFIAMASPLVAMAPGTNIGAAHPVMLGGILGYWLLPVSSLPQVDFPTIQVTAELAGANPETMAAAQRTLADALPLADDDAKALALQCQQRVPPALVPNVVEVLHIEALAQRLAHQFVVFDQANA